MKNFRNSLPSTLFNDNSNLDAFVNLLDAFKRVTDSNIDDFVRLLYYPLNEEKRTMIKFLWMFRGFYIESYLTKKGVDCLFTNYKSIYLSKGTAYGLELFISCLLTEVASDVTINSFDAGELLLLSDSYKAFDQFPDGQLIADDLLDVNNAQTLLGGSWELYKATIDITITLIVGQTITQTYKDFIKGLIPRFLPMVVSDFLIININYI